MLLERLRRLEDMGVVERRVDEGGKNPGYFLTDAGEDLRPVLRTLGEWAARWVPSDREPW